MAYATLTELADHLAPAVLPPGAARLLARASRDVDDALTSARYDVDDDGNPTNEDVAVALRDATLEQVAEGMAGGDSDGFGARYDSVSIGPVSLSRGGSGGGSASSGELGAQARRVLRGAGLLGHEPWTW